MVNLWWWSAKAFTKNVSIKKKFQSVQLVLIVITMKLVFEDKCTAFVGGKGSLLNRALHMQCIV